MLSNDGVDGMISIEDKKWCEEFLDKCEKKIFSVMDYIKNDYPYTTIDGKYDNLNIFPFSWTSGFWGGFMWLLYLETGKDEYKKRAIKCSERMNEALAKVENYDCLDNHDLGFVFLPTCVAHYRILGDENARIRGLHAASMLAGRFNLNGKYIRAWRNGILSPETRGYAIIDCLLNLPLLYWASDTYEDNRFALFAKAHADTVVKEFIKPDGSVYHIVNFDTETGRVKEYPRGQGYESGSSWSRGQAWGVYGFMMSYIHIKDEKYLNASKGIADYIIKNMGNRTIVPSDYMQPDSPEIVDASASAITACGMLELAKYLDDGEKYEEFAMKLLKGLYEDCDFSDKNQAIIMSATEMYHGNGTNHHIPIIYSEYFLIEALMKCIDKTDYFMW